MKTSNEVRLEVPLTPAGASIAHDASYTSFSFEPAFWVEFFGNKSMPNNFTFTALNTLIGHGLRPRIRPGGITMDSMIFEPSAGDPVRTTDADGAVYRTTVGPDYYRSWSNFPPGVEFTSTLNFGNDSLDIARDMAVASVQYQDSRILYFELGNEPTNYPGSRWDNSTTAYVEQWRDWTTSIDKATTNRSKGAWWASSATTDETPLHVRPADLIPKGIDATDAVAQYSIHSYAFATCDPARAAIATIPNILNHTRLISYADSEIMPSARAALDAGQAWIIGEFNSIACSGAPNVSDSFAQALWTVDTQLIYAVRNASATYLHQGATLVLQSDEQLNTAGEDGVPGFSTYDMLYPRASAMRGEQRTLPGFVGLLFLAEAFAERGTRVAALDLPQDTTEYLAAYAFYVGDNVKSVAVLNMRPYYTDQADDFAVNMNVAELVGSNEHCVASVKRMTAPCVDEKASESVTWAGQSFKDGTAQGGVHNERVGANNVVRVRGSEAVLISLREDDRVSADGRGKHWWHPGDKS